MPRRKRTPPTPYRSGFKIFGFLTKKAVTPEEVRSNLPTWLELWDGADGTKAITVKPAVEEGFYRIRVVARHPRNIPMTEQQLAALLGE